MKYGHDRSHNKFLAVTWNQNKLLNKYEETWNTEYSFLKDRKVTTSGDWLIVI